MAQPADKVFGGGPCNPQGPFCPDPDPEKGFTPPVEPSVDPAANFPSPWGPMQLSPDQAVADGLEIDQFLNRQAMALKAAGGEVLVYRQKKFGQTCACVDPATNQPLDGCLACYGTRFVGGYDLMGKTAAYIGPSPMVRKMTEIGIAVEQKPIVFCLPDLPLLDRDFIVAKMRQPVINLVRFQSEPVIRAAADPSMDLLSRINVRTILNVSATPSGTSDFEQYVDFVLTGGELVVEDALTPPPNPDTRILRVLGKRAPLSPPDGETATGETDPVRTLFRGAGLWATQAATVFNRASNPQFFSVALQQGSGADASHLVITLAGSTGSGISDKVIFPAAGFLTLVTGDAILWLEGGEKPADGATYYVSYDAAINVTKRYQVIRPTDYTYQDVVIAQQADVELMDVTHPIYNVASIYDNGVPLDRQVGNLDVLRKMLAAKNAMVTGEPNVSDPRFQNPADFLPEGD